MAVYLNRRNQLENVVDDNAVLVFVKMLKAWLKIDFNYLRNDLEKFRRVWCYIDVLCSIVDDELIFGSVLRLIGFCESLFC